MPDGQNVTMTNRTNGKVLVVWQIPTPPLGGKNNSGDHPRNNQEEAPAAFSGEPKIQKMTNLKTWNIQ